MVRFLNINFYYVIYLGGCFNYMILNNHCIFVGLVVGIILMCRLKWNFSKFSKINL